MLDQLILSPPESTAVAISLAATPAHRGKLFADLTTEARRGMDGVRIAVEKRTAMEMEGDEDEAAVAAIVSSRAATATQARRTDDDDLSDHALDEECRLAIAGGGLAKLPLILFSGFVVEETERVIRKNNLDSHRKTFVPRLCSICRELSHRARWTTCASISIISEETARRPRGRRCKSTSSRCRIRRRQTRRRLCRKRAPASPLRCHRRRRQFRSPPACSRPPRR